MSCQLPSGVQQWFITLSGHLTQMPLSGMSAPLQRVVNILVSPSNPPREDLDGMDSQRCTELHNAIFEHGWICSGRAPEEFYAESQTWEGHYARGAWDRFHPSVQAFLSGARVLPNKIDQ